MARMIEETGRLRRRTLYPVGLIATALALLLLVAGAVVAAVGTRGTSSSQRTSSAAFPAAASLPDTIFALNSAPSSNPAEVVTGVSAYLPGSNSFAPVLDGADQPLISPDGRQLIFAQVLRAGDQARAALVAMTSSGLERQWATPVATFSTSALNQGNLGSLGVSMAATADRVYAVPTIWNMKGPITVVGLDRTTGADVSRWQIDIGNDALNGARLYAAPDGQHLYLLLGTMGNVIQPAGMLYLRLRLTDGQVEERHPLLDRAGQPTYFWSTSQTPDGRTLYQISPGNQASQAARIDFLDLTTGTLLPRLEIPFRGEAGFATEEAISHDGRLLYVFAPLAREMAVVDLQTRQVQGVTPVDGATSASAPSWPSRLLAALHGIFVQPAAAKFSLSSDMQLSPDGRLLYAAGIQGQGFEAMPSGVWVIDTSTWGVVERWLPNAQPAALLLGQDGRHLYVQTFSPSGMSAALQVIDTGSGTVSSMPAPGNGSIFALAGLYRDRYGRSPGAAGIATGTPPDFVPAAALVASISSGPVLTGDRVTVEARFVDPRGGTPVHPGQKGYRYDPPSRVIATLRRDTGDAAVDVALQPAGYGVYRGSATLPSAGTWSLWVAAERPGGASSRAMVEGAVAVQTAYTGNDGRRYALRFTTDPAGPTVDQPFTVRLAFVDAERGTPLPAGTTLDARLPQTLDLTLYRSGARSVTLRATSHGVYEATTSLWASASWSGQVAIPMQDGTVSYVTAGAVAIAPSRSP